MRRVVAAVVVGALLATATACASGTGPVSYTTGTASGSSRATVSASPSGVPARLNTRQACTLAVKLTGDVVILYDAQVAVIEKAAAAGDTAAMVEAAEAIHEKFTDVAATLSALAPHPISQAVKTKIAQVAAALTEMSSPQYPGSLSDIKKRLADLARAVAGVCA